MLLQLLQEGHEMLLVFLFHGRLMRMSTKYVDKNSLLPDLGMTRSIINWMGLLWPFLNISQVHWDLVVTLFQINFA
jgi:hypothetical protein